MFAGQCLYYLHSALVEKIAHLLRDPVPSACRIISENHAYSREQDKNQRRERKDRVIGKGGAQLRRIILHPFLKRLL